MEASGAKAAVRKPSRASWREEEKAYLLKLLLKFPASEVNGKSFRNKATWEKIAENMIAEFTIKQIKEQEQQFRKTWKDIQEILKIPAFRWDDKNCMLEATNDSWVELGSGRNSTKYMTYRGKSIRHYDSLRALYKDYGDDHDEKYQPSGEFVRATINEPISNPIQDQPTLQGFHPEQHLEVGQSSSSDVYRTMLEYETLLNTDFSDVVNSLNQPQFQQGDINQIHDPSHQEGNNFTPSKPENSFTHPQPTNRLFNLDQTGQRSCPPIIASEQLGNKYIQTPPMVKQTRDFKPEPNNISDKPAASDTIGLTGIETSPSVQHMHPNYPPMEDSSLNTNKRKSYLNDNADKEDQRHRRSPQDQGPASSSEQPIEHGAKKRKRKAKVAAKANFSTVQCLKLYEELGLQCEDSDYVVEIFRDSHYRKAFVALTKEKREKWLHIMVDAMKRKTKAEAAAKANFSTGQCLQLYEELGLPCEDINYVVEIFRDRHYGEAFVALTKESRKNWLLIRVDAMKRTGK